MSLMEITLGFFFVTLALFIGQLYLYFRSKWSIDFLYASLFFLCSSIFLFGQFQLTQNFTSEWAVFWSKFQFLGIFGFLYTVPLLSATVMREHVGRKINLGLGFVTVIILGLIVFTKLILSNQLQLYLGVVRAGRGIIFFPVAALIILVASYFYVQIIRTARRYAITPAEYVPNYTPAIFGIGIALVCGFLDVLGIILNRAIIPGVSQPFTIFGVFVVSISYAWTFLSRYSRFFNALDESQLNHDRLVERYNRNFIEFVHLIAKTIDAKDHYTAGHSLRVRDYCINIAKVLNLPDSDITLLEQAALLHDIGKIATPDGILNKKAPLTMEEREHINMHPVVAKQILSTVSDFEDILDIIYNHHERIDGKGYPDGKSREQIPLLSKIIAVADTYDAMLSERPYRSAKTKKEAIEELMRVKGTQLDHDIVERFLKVITE